MYSNIDEVMDEILDVYIWESLFDSTFETSRIIVIEILFGVIGVDMYMILNV